jgi:hypothetical protein
MGNKEFYINTIVTISITILAIIFNTFDLKVIAAVTWVFYIVIHGVNLIPVASHDLVKEKRKLS